VASEPAAPEVAEVETAAPEAVVSEPVTESAAEKQAAPAEERSSSGFGAGI